MLKIFLLNFLIFLTLQAQIWFNHGPLGGHITAVAIDPTDTNIVYAGTYGAGIYRSMDGGLNWAQIINGLPVRTDSSIGSPTEPSWWFGDYFPVTTIKISPQNSSNLYLGTYGAGIVQSANKGETWIITNAGLSDSATIRVLWIHPQDSTFLLCGTDYPNGGLYKSTNSGSNWALVDSVPHSQTYHITTIVSNPVYPDSIFIGVSSAGEPGFAWGLIRSPDKGNIWEIISQEFSFYDLQVDPLNTQKLWSVGYTGFLEQMLFYSIDGGVSWNLYPNAINPWLGILAMYADDSWNVYIIDGGDILFRKSTDHGASWVSFPLSLPSYPIGILPGSGPNMTANPEHPETVYFGTNRSVYRSEDGGVTHTIKANGMINTYINEVAVNSKNPQIVYAGGNQGLWKSIDGGDHWIHLSTSSVNAIAIDPKYPDTLYWGGSDLMRSYDGGNSWEVIIQDEIVTAIEVRPDSTNKLFVGLYPSTLYMSYNWGDTWVVSYTPPHGSFWIEDIAIHKLNPQIMYFGTGRNILNHGLYKSIDGGLSWTKISNPGQIISIALHHNSYDTVFAASYEKILASYNGGMFFEEIGQSIPSNHMSKIVVDPDHYSHLFCGTKNKGVFYSVNSGQSWDLLSGEYNPRITDIDLILFQNQIYLGTHGSGLWRGDDIVLSTTPGKDRSSIPETSKMLQAYPNPFNNQIVISFFLVEREEIELAIYDIQGHLIKKFPNEANTTGYNRVYWYGKNEMNKSVASGIYFARLHSNIKNSILKIVLLK